MLYKPELQNQEMFTFLRKI